MSKKKISQKLNPRLDKDILWFNEIGISDVSLVGGKNASLGEMYSHLMKKGISVPNGFAVTAHAYWHYMESTGLKTEIKKALKDLDVTNVQQLAKVGDKIRKMIIKTPLPQGLKKEIEIAYKGLCEFEKTKDVSVAVRSSATAEDLPDASFAGQQETYLNVLGVKSLELAVKKCIASLFTNRAISYRENKGFDHLSVALSVTVQTMVHSDVGASGVMFTLDTESGFQGVVLINASYGLGEYVVKGRVTPDQFYVFKEGLKQNKKSIISKVLGTKEVQLVYARTGGTKQTKVSKANQNKYAISEDDVMKLAKWAMEIEQYYKRPQDIEWAKDGNTGKLYIVQARPETVKSRNDATVIETYELKKKSKVILQGISVGQKIGAGKVHIIDSPTQMKLFKKGEVLVTRITDPDWEPIMRIASAIITEQGGKTSHAAIVSRELGVPCIVGAKHARKVLKNGQHITVSCADGDNGMIYSGVLPFEVKKTEIGIIEETKTKIMMNVGDPDNAFGLSFLPHNGVGLAREEFIFSNFIRVHPLALVHYNELKDKKAKNKIAEITRGYKVKTDYCVDRLAQGIARIATAFYPQEVIIRLSDFKSNEYATLIGGREFEPKEENPMLGWRGASRYYSSEYKQAFKLECDAIKRVRDEWGLTNVITMVPFCRTPEEGKKVIETMAEFGLKQGENGLQVYVMCEIPSNVILAEDFAKIFDGFSIGTNDLTQLTLGVDRDSSLVSHVYSEKNEAVMTLIRNVIKTAHTYKRKVGICGQAPSDYPDFAEFLVREGVDSISLNPDTVVATKQRIAYVEKTLGKKGNKTHKAYLALISGLALLSAALMLVGSGCRLTEQISRQEPQPEISAAQIRQYIEQKTQAMVDEEKQQPTQKLHIGTFENFDIFYPVGWEVEQWNGGVTLKKSNSDEYVSLFKQLVNHPVADDVKEHVTIAGKEAVRYAQVKSASLSFIQVVEIPIGEYIFEINSNASNFDEIIKTLSFGDQTNVSSAMPTHWDVLEKRICVQMITYARGSEDSSCVAFATPCDVPDSWQVCDASDL